MPGARPQRATAAQHGVRAAGVDHERVGEPGDNRSSSADDVAARTAAAVVGREVQPAADLLDALLRVGEPDQLIARARAEQELASAGPRAQRRRPRTAAARRRDRRATSTGVPGISSGKPWPSGPSTSTASPPRIAASASVPVPTGA